MRKVANYLKKIKIQQILTVFLAGVVLLISTACNSGDIRGARPTNPPVQAGGQNNPHKMGGDGYTQYKASPKAKVKDAAFNVEFDSLIAQRTSQSPESREDKMLYTHDTKVNKEQIPVISTGEKGLKQAPLDNKDITDRSNSGGEGYLDLDKVGDTFEKSSNFIREGVDEAFSGSGR